MFETCSRVFYIVLCCAGVFLAFVWCYYVGCMIVVYIFGLIYDVVVSCSCDVSRLVFLCARMSLESCVACLNSVACMIFFCVYID